MQDVQIGPETMMPNNEPESFLSVQPLMMTTLCTSTCCVIVSDTLPFTTQNHHAAQPAQSVQKVIITNCDLRGEILDLFAYLSKYFQHYNKNDNSLGEGLNIK